MLRINEICVKKQSERITFANILESINCVMQKNASAIKYNIFKTDAKLLGKCFKVIFKATNCKDYDARVLACKTEPDANG